MSTLLFQNNASSTLSGAITNTSTTLQLAAGGGALFPSPTSGQYFVLTATDAATGLLREIMWCTSRATDTLTVVRAQESTVASSWNPGDLINMLWTAGQAAQMLQQGQAPSSTIWFGVDTGAVNAMVATVSPTIASLANGNLFQIAARFSNTTTSVTLDITQIGTPYPVVRGDGSALQVGDIAGPISAQIYSWNAANTEFLLMTPAVWKSVFTLANGFSFYVNYATGSDSNSGLTSSLPFKTIQGAVTAIASNYSSTTYINIYIADSTSYLGFTVPTSLIAQWNFIGDSGNPNNVLVSASTTSVNLGYAATALGANVSVYAMKFSAYYSGFRVTNGIGTVDTCHFAGTQASYSNAVNSYTGGNINIQNACSFTGSFATVLSANYGGALTSGFSPNPAATLTYSCTASVGTAYVSTGGNIDFYNPNVTNTGAVTGPRYSAGNYSTINTNGAGANYFPGTSAGGGGGTYE